MRKLLLGSLLTGGAAVLWSISLDHSWTLPFKGNGEKVRFIGRVAPDGYGGLVIDTGTATLPLAWESKTTRPTPGSISFVYGSWVRSERRIEGIRRFTIWPGNSRRRD